MQILVRRRLLYLTSVSSFKEISILRDKQDLSLEIKSSTHQKDINILNLYAPNNMTSKYIMPKLRSK